MRIMEGLDIDELVDVPDTPDRLGSQHVITRESMGRDCWDSSSAEKFRRRVSRDALFGNHVNGPRGKDKPIAENGHGRRLIINPPKSFNNHTESSFGYQNERLFRKAVDESFSHRAKHTSGVRNVDKGKAVSIGKSSNHEEDIDFFYQMKCDEYAKNSKAVRSEDKKKEKMASIGSSSGSRGPDSLEIFGNGFIENGKSSASTPNNHGLVAHGETTVLSPDSQISHSSPRVTGRKCLVRNGCISPQNVAKVEQLKNRSKNVEPSHNANGSSRFTPNSLDIMSELVADEKENGKRKGKAKVIIPDASKNRSNEANRVGNADRNALESQGLGGWRTTHCHSRKPDNAVPEERNSERIRDSGSLSCRRESDVALAASATEVGQSTGQITRSGNSVTKRLKKRGHSSTSQGECSTSTMSVPENQDVMFLEPSREPKRSRTSRPQRPQSRAMLGPIIEVDDDLSPPPARRSNNDDDSDIRAMQVQADEMLARELQEQLYHETPMVGGGETNDEYLAWVMQQQEENRPNTSNARRNASHSRSSATSRRVQRNARWSGQTARSSRGRSVYSQTSTSSRLALIRARTQRRRPASLSRARDLEFPLHMDLDMRLDILEALENAIGDVNMDNNPILQVQRDFNENDYEMLLALDEQDNRHGGASTNLINSLPHSVVQTNNQEACAVCLETPSIGETVRHLPCLHKFHKDCIDPWLRRKTSCPVCKSSIN